jgi:hypothetical protein
MENILYAKTIVEACESADGETPTQIVLTEETNGFAFWRCDYDKDELLEFVRYGNHYQMIEKAVLLGLKEAKAADPLSGEADYMRGYNRAVEGVHELFTHDSGTDGTPDHWADKPICRFVRVSERGDASVGIPDADYWALADDQSGTVLAEIIKDQ